jgi:hypothetical protein
MQSTEFRITIYQPVHVNFHCTRTSTGNGESAFSNRPPSPVLLFPSETRRNLPTKLHRHSRRYVLFFIVHARLRVMERAPFQIARHTVQGHPLYNNKKPAVLEQLHVVYGVSKRFKNVWHNTSLWYLLLIIVDVAQSVIRWIKDPRWRNHLTYSGSNPGQVNHY